jgi:DNA polymerase III subunit beta
MFMYFHNVMQISITKQQLLKPLHIACSIVDRKTTSPILNNILIECQNNQLRFITNDTEIQISHILPTENINDFSTTVAAKKFFDIIKVLNEDVIQFDIQEHKIIIQQQQSRFELHTLPSKDFPLMALKMTDAIELSLTPKQFKHQLNHVAFCMAMQDVRYYLNGMLLKIENQQLILVTTDGHRLACSKAHCQIDPNIHIEVIIPRKTVIELLRLIDDKDKSNDELIKIEIHPQQIMFHFMHTQLISKLIDGKFPDYKRIIPENHPHIVAINRPNFGLSLQRAAILTHDKLRAARFIFNTNQLTLLANNGENEEVKEILNISYAGELLEISFNIAYWMDAINMLKHEELNIHVNNANSSAVLNSNDDLHTYQYVVMPMRI